MSAAAPYIARMAQRLNRQSARVEQSIDAVDFWSAAVDGIARPVPEECRIHGVGNPDSESAAG